MARFIFRRVISMIFVLFVVSVLVFAIFNVLPGGDPAVRMAGKQPTETQIEAIRKEWGFDKGVVTQYTTTISKVFTGDLKSYFTQLDVVNEIWKGLAANALPRARRDGDLDGLLDHRSGSTARSEPGETRPPAHRSWRSSGSRCRSSGSAP